MTKSRIGIGLWAVVLAISMSVFGCSDKVPLDPGSDYSAGDQPSYMLAKGKGQENGKAKGQQKVRPVKRKNSQAAGNSNRNLEVSNGAASSEDCVGTVAQKRMNPGIGGALEHCGHRMMVPPGALDQSKVMSIEVLSSNFIDVEFGPDGRFLTPITVRLSYKDADLTGIDIDNLTIAWYDEANDEWIDIGGIVNKARQYVEVHTDHFTQYALAVR